MLYALLVCCKDSGGRGFATLAICIYTVALVQPIYLARDAIDNINSA